MRGVAYVVAAVLLVIGIGVGVEAGIGPGAAQQVGHAADVSRVSPAATGLSLEMEQLALNLAASAGDPHPTQLSWVAYTWKGIRWTNHGVVKVRTPLYALEIVGHFVLNGVPVALPEDGPSGSVLSVQLFQNGWGIDSIGVQDRVDDMRSEGKVHTVSLIGIPALGAAAQTTWPTPTTSRS